MMHRSCFRPRSETGISIGPRSTEFGAASPEASVELDPLCARCTYMYRTISQYKFFCTARLFSGEFFDSEPSEVSPSYFGSLPKPPSTRKHTEYPRSRLRGYCGRSIPTPPQRASPTCGFAATPRSGLETGRLFAISN